METQPATKKSKRTSSKNTPANPGFTILRKAKCKSLQGKTTLTYLLGTDDNSALHWKLEASTGAGIFDCSWIAFGDIQAALSGSGEETPITGMALRSVFKGKSVNTPSFLLATLVSEGILQPVEGKQRHYQIGDVKAFQAEVKKLMAAHSKPRKRKSKAEA
jgi:hypothetical protein